MYNLPCWVQNTAVSRMCCESIFFFYQKQHFVNNNSNTNYLVFLQYGKCDKYPLSHSCTPQAKALSKWLLCDCRLMFWNNPVVGHTYRHSQQVFTVTHYFFTAFAINKPLPSFTVHLQGGERELDYPNLQQLFKKVEAELQYFLFWGQSFIGGHHSEMQRALPKEPRAMHYLVKLCKYLPELQPHMRVKSKTLRLPS